MTDIADSTEIEQPAEIKPAPKVKEKRACFCQAFEVRGDEADEIFNTGCEQTTGSTFAQGHDARLVSFLVEAHFDGYSIWTVLGGNESKLDSPAAAASLASASLGVKAEKATANRHQRDEAKAEKKAAAEKAKAEKKAAAEKAKAEKASAPKSTGAEVAAGSQEGDLPELAEGQARIKVGRFEYVADIDEAGVATFTNGKGEVETREVDGYRVLTPTA